MPIEQPRPKASIATRAKSSGMNPSIRDMSEEKRFSSAPCAVVSKKWTGARMTECRRPDEKTMSETVSVGDVEQTAQRGAGGARLWILALALVVMPSYSTIPVGGEGRQRVKAGGRRGDGGGARLTTDCAAGDTGERDERVDDEVALDLGPVGCRRRRPLAQPPGREQLERLRADVGRREDEPVDEASLQQRTAAG